jgi:hypothetical protein
MSNYSVDQLELLIRLYTIGSQFQNFNKSFVPPALLDPSYVPPYNGQGVLGMSIFLGIATIIVVGLRLWTRASGSWGWDDWCIIPATVSARIARWKI